MNTKKLKEKFNKIALKYIETFTKKHDLSFSGAVEYDDLYSHLIFINEIVITLEDVITDLELNLSGQHLMDWWYSPISTGESYSFYLRSIKFNQKETIVTTKVVNVGEDPF